MGGPPMVAALSRRVATATPVALVGPVVSSATGSGSSSISLGGGALVSLLLPGFRKRERRKRGERSYEPYSGGNYELVVAQLSLGGCE